MSQSRLINDPWLLQGTHAKLACDALLAELDVERPTRGLHHLKLSVEPLEGWLMAVSVDGEQVDRDSPWQVADVYTRGRDLVATYREPLGQPFNLQVYWRALESVDRQAVALEAIISIQTREWEAHPQVVLSSALNVDSAVVENGGILFRSHHDWAYVEATLPGDFKPAAGEASETRGPSSTWTYGNHFMERGVIRRLRLRGAIVPIAEAEQAVETLGQRLAMEPLPLTA